MRNTIISITVVVLTLTGITSAQELDVNNEIPFNPDQLHIPNRDTPRRDLDAEELDAFIQQTMRNNNIPGVATCVVRHGRTGWIGNHGWANVNTEIPVTQDIMFHTRSIAKTITAAAAMQLWENGEFALDDPINAYIPDFDVVHPNFPNVPITFRMLLTHTSSLIETPNTLSNQVGIGEDGPWAHRLGEFLQNYLVPGGQFYNDTLYSPNNPPGASRIYSTVGVALLGYLVECIAGQDFYEYCQDSIFMPLGMENSSWFMDDLDWRNMAQLYYANGQIQPWPSRPDGPGVNLSISSYDLSQFLTAMVQHGRNGDVRILEGATVDTMLTVAFRIDFDSEQGLIWYRREYEGDFYWGHTGGWGTIVSFHLPTSTAVVVSANRLLYEVENALWSIHWELYDHAFEYMNFGAFEGQVLDAETDEPIEGATISTLYGRTTQSDEDGKYLLSFGDSTVEVSVLGYNNLIIDSLECAVEDTLELDFHMLHPELALSVEAFNEQLIPNHEAIRQFTISDSGNGTLEWSVECRLSDESGVDPWELRQSHNAGQELSLIHI